MSIMEIITSSSVLIDPLPQILISRSSLLGCGSSAAGSRVQAISFWRRDICCKIDILFISMSPDCIVH